MSDIVLGQLIFWIGGLFVLGWVAAEVNGWVREARTRRLVRRMRRGARPPAGPPTGA